MSQVKRFLAKKADGLVEFSDSFGKQLKETLKIYNELTWELMLLQGTYEDLHNAYSEICDGEILEDSKADFREFIQEWVNNSKKEFQIYDKLMSLPEEMVTGNNI